jgi:predicted glycoside hydrolase/deacetylase ChbG (UPF0249 family)
MLKTMDQQQEPGPPVDSPVVIVNADDWGIRARATDRILDCIRLGTVSSTSAMVFMADSQRAAELARQEGVDTGLHLNLTAQFDGEGAGLRRASSIPGLPLPLSTLSRRNSKNMHAFTAQCRAARTGTTISICVRT